MFTETLPSNKFRRLFVAAESYLASRWLAMDFRSGSTIPVFRRHDMVPEGRYMGIIRDHGNRRFCIFRSRYQERTGKDITN
jgi:hypothetical protein